MDGGYDIGYKACSCFWGKEPGSMVKHLVQNVGSLEGLNALDAGCGEGKNAVYLAKEGASVRAIDISELALSNARLAWLDTERITWEQGDIRHVHFDGETFDVVVAYGVAHCLLNRQEIEEVMAKLQRATRVGGYHAFCSFNSRAQDLSAHPDLAPCLVPHEFYMELYSRWCILEATDADLEEVHPHNKIRHKHSLTRIIARKTNR